MNIITLSGKKYGDIEFSHETYGEKFFKFKIETERLSKTKDVIPCIVPEIILNDKKDFEDIKVIGQIRTRNFRTEDGKRHLEIYVFVNEILPYPGLDENYVEISGAICKEPAYRSTQLKRKICDLLLAVNRETTWKSDYVPCVAWGRNALMTAFFEVGDNVEILGRLQSRGYIKKLDDGTEETKTAYEVSASTARLVKEQGGM